MRYIFLVLVPLVLAGCTLVDGTEQETQVRTDRSTYSLSEVTPNGRIVITATFYNHTGDAIYILPCGEDGVSFHVEKQEGGAWVVAYDRPCLLVSDKNIRVENGASYTAPSWIEVDRLKVDRPTGLYRLVWPVMHTNPRIADKEFEEVALPPANRVSNPFAVAE